MSRLSNDLIWKEMARRYLKFHKGKDWSKIEQFGLFNWGNVSHLIKSGELLTTMRKENKTIWVYPSKDAWGKCIKPLIDKYSLDELSMMTGRRNIAGEYELWGM